MSHQFIPNSFAKASRARDSRLMTVPTGISNIWAASL